MVIFLCISILSYNTIIRDGMKRLVKGLNELALMKNIKEFDIYLFFYY